MIDQYKSFLEQIYYSLDSLGVDTTPFELDHIAYQVSNDEEFDSMLEEVKNYADVVRIPIVKERRVGVFRLKESWTYRDQSFEAIEVIEPKPGKIETSRLEHAEFLTPYSFKELMEMYPHLEWDTSSINREEFAHLKLPLDGETQVKFPKGSII